VTKYCVPDRVSFASLDPIWTVKNGSLFLLEVESEQLFIQDGMNFLVKDFDQFGANDNLGVVHVKPDVLYKAKGERMEFKLQPVSGKIGESIPGYLAIRCRRATPHDLKFMEGLATSVRGIAAPEGPKVANNPLMSIVHRTSKTENGVKKVSGTNVIVALGSDLLDVSSYLTECIHIVQSSPRSRSGTPRGDRMDDERTNQGRSNESFLFLDR